jgi:DNA polymerase III delta subunit
MTYTDFRQHLKSTSSPPGSFLFCGPEEYTKLAALRELRALPRFSGSSVKIDCAGITADEQSRWLGELSDELSGLSMFAADKLVELHAINFAKLKEQTLPRLLALLGELEYSPETTVVLYAEGAELDIGDEKRRPKPYRDLAERITPVTFEHERGERLLNWVGRHFTSCGAEIDMPTLQVLVDYCGTDMSILAAEAQKLAYYSLAAGKKRIDRRDIPVVCRCITMTGAFDFSNALMNRDIGDALRLLSEMKSRREPPEIVLAAIVSHVTQSYLIAALAEQRHPKGLISQETGIHEYKVGLIMNAVRGTPTARLAENLRAASGADRKIKTTGLESYTVISNLIVRILR